MIAQIIELGKLLGGLLFFMALNIACGSGTANLQQTFDKEILLNGIKKALFAFCGAVLICGAGLCLPEFEIALAADGGAVTIFEALRVGLIAAVTKYGYDGIKNFITMLGATTSLKATTGHESLPETTELVMDEDVVDVEVESVG